MHSVPTKWRFGLLLAASAAVMWAILPLALQSLPKEIDLYTATFFRYSLPALALTPYLLFNNRISNLRVNLSSRNIILLFLSGCFLAGNYGLYIFGLEKISADSSQVIIQLAPISLLLAGIYIFKESFSKFQWLGFLGFLIGLFVFFYDRIHMQYPINSVYFKGLLATSVAAFCWTGYAIILKILTETFSSQEVMMICYWIGTVLFFPFTDLSQVLKLSPFELCILGFCGINTLITYTCFSEALERLEASRVSAVISSTPILTISMIQFLPVSFLNSEPLSTLSFCGALMVVAGSITTAVAKKS